MYDVPYTGWSPAKYANDNSHGKRDYYRALFEHVRALPAEELEMPVYVLWEKQYILLADVAAISQTEEAPCETELSATATI